MSEQQENLSLTFRAHAPEPHVHLDNRALIVHDGNRTLRIGASSFPWVSETLHLIADEGRATRSSGQLFAGGHVGEDRRLTLYFGIGEDFVAVSVDEASFQALRDALGQTQHRRS